MLAVDHQVLLAASAGQLPQLGVGAVNLAQGLGQNISLTAIPGVSLKVTKLIVLCVCVCARVGGS